MPDPEEVSSQVPVMFTPVALLERALSRNFQPSGLSCATVHALLALLIPRPNIGVTTALS